MYPGTKHQHTLGEKSTVLELQGQYIRDNSCVDLTMFSGSIFTAFLILPVAKKYSMLYRNYCYDTAGLIYS